MSGSVKTGALKGTKYMIFRVTPTEIKVAAAIGVMGVVGYAFDQGKPQLGKRSLTNALLVAGLIASPVGLFMHPGVVQGSSLLRIAGENFAFMCALVGAGTLGLMLADS